MKLRITKTENGVGSKIKIDGEFFGPGISELDGVYQAARAPVRFDLSGVRSIDREGIVAIRRLVEIGAKVESASQYVELLLRLGGVKLREKKKANAKR